MIKQIAFNHPPKVSPRLYQAMMVAKVKSEVLSGDLKSFLIASPPGTGKGNTACMIIKKAAVKGMRVLFMVHKVSLMRDIMGRLTDTYGMARRHIGLVYGRKNQSNRDVVFTTQLTAYRRLEKFDLSSFDLILIDEAHRTGSGTYQKILSNTDAKLIGLTGTPWREDSTMLSNFYEKMEWMTDMDHALENGYVVPTVPYAPVHVDLGQVRIRSGEFVGSDLDEIFQPYDQVVVDQYLKLGEGRKTIVFCNSVQQAHRLVPLFRQAGFTCDAIYHGMKRGKRNEVEKAFAEGRLQVLLNIQVFTEGHDDPPTSCVIWATATQSKLKYVQATMRGIRSYPGKKDCIVIDLGNNTHRHGCVEDFMEAETVPTKECPSCTFTMRDTANKCPGCGVDFVTIHREETAERAGRAVEPVQADPGELARVERMRMEEKILHRYLRQEGKWKYNEDLVVVAEYFGWPAWKVFEKIAEAGRAKDSRAQARMEALFLGKTNKRLWIQYYNAAILKLAKRGMYYKLTGSDPYYFIKIQDNER